MNVPYYLTIEKGLVHFGSEVRKISYRFIFCSILHWFHISLVLVKGHQPRNNRRVSEFVVWAPRLVMTSFIAVCAPLCVLVRAYKAAAGIDAAVIWHWLIHSKKCSPGVCDIEWGHVWVWTCIVNHLVSFIGQMCRDWVRSDEERPYCHPWALCLE